MVKKAQTFIEMEVKKRVILRYRDWKNEKNSEKYVNVVK